jgi:hypothetical protein
MWHLPRADAEHRSVACRVPEFCSGPEMEALRRRGPTRAGCGASVCLRRGLRRIAGGVWPAGAR